MNIKQIFEEELMRQENLVDKIKNIISVIKDDTNLFQEEIRDTFTDDLKHLEENIKRQNILKKILNSDFITYKYFCQEVIQQGSMEIFQPIESFDINKMILIRSMSELELNCIFNHDKINCLISTLFKYEDNVGCVRKGSWFVYENDLYLNINLVMSSFGWGKDYYLITHCKDYITEIINEKSDILVTLTKKLQILNQDKQNDTIINDWKTNITTKIFELEEVINSLSEIKLISKV